MKELLPLSLALVLGGAVAASAQTAPAAGVVACPEQQDIEQYLASDGELMPDGCRRVEIIHVESEGRMLCAIDLGGAEEGVLGQIRDVATTTRWWAECASLAAELP